MSNETISLFQKTAKPRVIEEWIDFYFHRRLASLLLPLLHKLRLSPNQVTLLSLVTGLSSAFLFYQNKFFFASLFLLLAVVLDCADGMLARFLGVSSPLGRILDGYCDAIWVAFIWFALYFSRHFYWGPGNHLLIFMAFSGASMFIHCNTFDAIKIAYLQITSSDFKEGNLSTAQATQLFKKSLQEKKYSLTLGYLAHMIYESSLGRKQIIYKPTQTLSDESTVALSQIVRRANFLGEGTHLFIIMTGGLLSSVFKNSLLLSFMIILIPLNFLWILTLRNWFTLKKKILQPS